MQGRCNKSRKERGVRKLFLINAMIYRYMGSEGIAPCIFNLSIGSQKTQHSTIPVKSPKKVTTHN
jgi:hypothetical protein